MVLCSLVCSEREATLPDMLMHITCPQVTVGNCKLYLFQLHQPYLWGHHHHLFLEVKGLASFKRVCHSPGKPVLRKNRFIKKASSFVRHIKRAKLQN